MARSAKPDQPKPPATPPATPPPFDAGAPEVARAARLEQLVDDVAAFDPAGNAELAELVERAKLLRLARSQPAGDQ